MSPLLPFTVCFFPFSHIGPISPRLCFSRKGQSVAIPLFPHDGSPLAKPSRWCPFPASRSLFFLVPSRSLHVAFDALFPLCGSSPRDGFSGRYPAIISFLPPTFRTYHLSTLPSRTFAAPLFFPLVVWQSGSGPPSEAFLSTSRSGPIHPFTSLHSSALQRELLRS